MLPFEGEGNTIAGLELFPALKLRDDPGTAARDVAVNQCVHTKVLVVLHIYGNFRAFLDILGADTQNDLFASVRSKCALLRSVSQ